MEQIKKSKVITPRTAAENRKLLEKYTKIVHVNRDIDPIDRESLINKQSDFDDEIVNSCILSTPIKPYHDLGTIDDARPRSDDSGMNGRKGLVGVIDVERELHLEPRRREEPSQPSRKKILQLQPEAIERITAEITALPDIEDDDCEGDKDQYIKNMLTKYKRMAKVLYDNAEYAGALALYQAILQVDPEDFESLFTQGFAYRELEEYENAISSFKRILELFYDNGYAWYCLAVVYALLNKGAEELYCLKKAKLFGYDVDISRLSRLALTYIAKNPF
ncbi:tetratricopeptide repeat protein [Candidatus Bathyarchaeota archaeon]|nr:tetratricopeptide repeat protein [Candidatus Bathyarchaeota archaeon]